MDSKHEIQPRQSFSNVMFRVGKMNSVGYNVHAEEALYDAIKAFADKWGFSFNVACKLIGEQA